MYTTPTITIKFKKSTSKHFQYAMNICMLMDGFRYEDGYYIVTFKAEQIFKNQDAFLQFQEIFKYVGKWKDTQLSITGEGTNSNLILFSLLQTKYNELYTNKSSWRIHSVSEKQNPFNVGTDDWANWEIDNFKANKKEKPYE